MRLQPWTQCTKRRPHNNTLEVKQFDCSETTRPLISLSNVACEGSHMRHFGGLVSCVPYNSLLECGASFCEFQGICISSFVVCVCSFLCCSFATLHDHRCPCRCYLTCFFSCKDRASERDRLYWRKKGKGEAGWMISKYILLCDAITHCKLMPCQYVTVSCSFFFSTTKNVTAQTCMGSQASASFTPSFQDG